jgi:hypothetical protein
MDPEVLTRLLSFLHHIENEYAFINTRVDLDDLWNFFFSSGFIYPEKYSYLQDQREDIKRTYEEIYENNPGIGRYFVYQKNGNILGHIAMIRAYEDTWLLHHHAAGPRNCHNAGIHVLKQASNFAHSCQRIQSMHMEYLMCYYRPDNRFPSRVFGKVAEDIADPGSCSIDTFAYFYTDGGVGPENLPAGWTLAPASAADLNNFVSSYRRKSGGLMPEALQLGRGNGLELSLTRDYARSGLTRQIEYFAVKKHGGLQAILMQDISPAGLNLSELTNCIKVFITDHREITKSVLFHCLRSLAASYKHQPTAVLLFPEEAAEQLHIGIEKSYNLWVISVNSSDVYFKLLNGMFRSQGACA